MSVYREVAYIHRVPPLARPRTRAAAAGGRAGLGLEVRDVDGGGAVVIGLVEHGPAWDAEIHRGDVVIVANTSSIACAAAFDDALRAAQPGDVVTLGLMREGKVLSVRTRL